MSQITEKKKEPSGLGCQRADETGIDNVHVEAKVWVR